MSNSHALLCGIATLVLAEGGCTSDTNLGKSQPGTGGLGAGGASSTGGGATSSGGITDGGGITGAGGTFAQGGAGGSGTVCCNALYCPSGYTLVGPTGSGSCPAGYECIEFVSCGCNLVLCARPSGTDAGASPDRAPDQRPDVLPDLVPDPGARPADRRPG